MIKNILFFAATFISAGLMAQTFDLMDSNDNTIVGTTHYEYGNGNDLSLTKFHVGNVSGASASYTADVQEISNPIGVDLQVCYGTACYIAPAGASTVYQVGDQSTVASGAYDATFKVGPFSQAWVTGDSAIWKVIVRNVTDPLDTVSAVIIWKAIETTAVNEISGTDVELSAYPNPASDNLTVKYNVKGSVANVVLNVYDVLGQEIISKNLNGNKGSIKLNLEAVNSGVYFYAIKVAGNTVRTERFIVR